MKLRQLKQSLRDQVLAARFVPVLVEARQRESALAPHTSLLSVLAVLADSSAARWGEREAITRALVREHQRGAGSFWSSVLLLAYVPMLSYLRSRICGDAFDQDELDQMVVGAFLEAITRFDLDRRRDRTALRLRQDTERTVFAQLRREQAYNKHLAGLAIEASRDEDFEIFSSRTRRRKLSDDELEEVVEDLHERVAGRIPDKRLQVVIDTFLRGVRLYELAAAEARDQSDVERERAYQRLKRGRHRTLQKLRPLLSLPEDDDSLGS